MDERSAYNQVNNAWKKTCKIVLGEEIGELKDYEEYLKGFFPTETVKKKSYLSGKDVIISTFSGKDVYGKNARFISQDEIKQEAIDPLTINQIKDIDSIIQAISEKWAYTGNIILGESQFVGSSCNIINSSYVYGSYEISDSYYVGYSSRLRKQSRYCFGVAGPLNEFVIIGMSLNTKRSLEALYIVNGSDIYYSFNCNGCSDLMFSFNLRNKRNCIGNLQLTKEKYKELKNKLLYEIREELKRNKKLPHLIELVSGKKPIYPPIEIKQEKEPEFDIKPINKAFQSVFKILFNKEIKDDLTTYQKYLSKYIILPEKFTSYYGSTVYSIGPPYPPLPSERLVSIKEAEKLSEIPLKIEEIDSFDKIKENLSKIGFFVGLFVEGQSMNFSHVYFAINTIHSYKVNDCTNTEYCAYDNMPLNSKYAFGCWRILESEFVLNLHIAQIVISCIIVKECKMQCFVGILKAKDMLLEIYNFLLRNINR